MDILGYSLGIGRELTEVLGPSWGLLIIPGRWVLTTSVLLALAPG